MSEHEEYIPMQLPTQVIAPTIKTTTNKPVNIPESIKNTK